MWHALLDLAARALGTVALIALAALFGLGLWEQYRRGRWR